MFRAVAALQDVTRPSGVQRVVLAGSKKMLNGSIAVHVVLVRKYL